MKKLIDILKRYRHAWILCYLPVYIAWFSSLEHEVTTKTGYHILHTRIDDMIPFCEYFVVPYFLWFAYIVIGGLYFLLKNKDDYYRLCAFLFSGMTVYLIICSIFPNGTDFRPAVDAGKNVFTRLVAWLYQTDTCTNVFPSIHAYNSIGMHIAISRSREIERLRFGRQIKAVSFILALMICLATLFLKQHSVLDVSGAVIMASIVYGFVYGYPAFAREGSAVRGSRQRI